MLEKKKTALFLDSSLDLSLGLIAAWVVAFIPGVHLTWLLLLLGIFGAYAPDIDVLFFLVKPWGEKGFEQLYKHRSGVHYPLLFLPVAGALVGGLTYMVSASPFVSTLVFMLGAFFHFVHDTFLHGWGISWLYPFSDKRIALFHHSRYRGALLKVLVFPIKRLQGIRNEHHDPEWNWLFRLPPHPWWYAVVAIHTMGLVVLVSR